MKRTLQVFNFSVQNAANDAVDIHIDGDIVDAETQSVLKAFWGDETSTSFKSFRDQLSKNPAKTYNVIINSNGGHLGDALAMHDWIIQKRSEGTTVNTKGIGIVASAGTHILSAGEEPEMTENSWFLAHNVSGGIWGDVNEIENYAKSLRKFNNQTRDFYAKITGKSADEITKIMNDGQFMTAQEAKEKGFIKKVTGAVDFKNSISKEQWQYADLRVLNAYNSSVKTPPHQTEDNKSYFDNKLEEMKKFFTDVVNSIKGVKPAENDDKQAIVNAVADAMQAPLERVGEEIETTITNQVNAALTSEAVTNAINAAVAAAVEPFKQKVADMEADVTNKLGQPTAATNSNSAIVIPQGQFSNQ